MLRAVRGGDGRAPPAPPHLRRHHTQVPPAPQWRAKAKVGLPFFCSGSPGLVGFAELPSHLSPDKRCRLIVEQLKALFGDEVRQLEGQEERNGGMTSRRPPTWTTRTWPGWSRRGWAAPSPPCPRATCPGTSPPSCRSPRVPGSPSPPHWREEAGLVRSHPLGGDGVGVRLAGLHVGGRGGRPSRCRRSRRRPPVRLGSFSGAAFSMYAVYTLDYWAFCLSLVHNTRCAQ